MKRWLKWFGGVLGVLLLVVVLALGWVLGTASGLRFALDRASTMTDGALSVQQAGGRLLGPLELRGLRYHDATAGVDVKVRRVQLDLRATPLLLKRLHLLTLNVEGVDVALTTPQVKPPAEPAGTISLAAPLDILLDRAQVNDIRISQDGQSVFAADHLDLAGAWTRLGITLKKLALTAPAGHVNAQGSLAVVGAWRGKGQAAFAWRQDGVDYAGTLASHGDGRNATLQLALTQPTAASLDFRLAQQGDYPWTAKLSVPRFDPTALTGSAALTSLAADFDAHGNRQSATLTGTLGLGDYQLALQPLQMALSEDHTTLSLRELVLSSPDVAGRVEASGQLQLDAQPVAATINLAWNGVELPPELLGQALASTGTLALKGNADRYHVQGDLSLGPPGKPSAISLDLDGSARELAIRSLALKQAQGGLEAHGSLTLQPELAWDLQVDGQRFDPGQLASGWDGALDFALATQGQFAKPATHATLGLDQLDGTLRQRPVRGKGRLQMDADKVLSGHLELAVGGSRVVIDGKPGQRNDIDMALHVASLADWLDGAGGQLDGDFTLRGVWPKLALTADARGHSLGLEENRVATFSLDADLPDLTEPGGRTRIHLGGVRLGDVDLGQIDLDANGTQARHGAKLSLQGPQLRAELAMHGRFAKGDWHGTLEQLDIEPAGIPAWRLEHAAAASLVQGNFQLQEACLSAGEPELCAQARFGHDGALDATWKLHALPTALLASLRENLPLRADGRIDGAGTLQRKPGAVLTGSASLHSDAGSLTWLDNPSGPALTWNALQLAAVLDPGGTRLEAHAGIGNNGTLEANATLGADRQTLAGAIKLHLDDLGFAELFSTEVANVHGTLDADFALDGTLSQPVLRGQATLDGFAAEVPGAGLKLEQGHVVARTTEASSLVLDGSLKSGAGTLTVGGNIGLGSNAVTQIRVQGDNVLAANIPAARLVVSPDLSIQQDAGKLELGGSVSIDRADIDLNKLPGAGAPQPSPDVVVIDRPEQAGGPAAALLANIRIDLGDKTRIKGFGLDGKLSGVLNVRQRPGREPTGQGQIVVDGTYRAYGQDLKIQRGRLLFASTPLDNPGLDLRATRSLRPNATIDEGQKVGLDISGTANKPVLTVFSNPMMAQSDALSYLVTGKPLSQVKGGEGNMVGAAAQALGSAAGDLLAKGVGARLGVDAGVSGNDALGGAAFTVGKYLSPRLYLSYGVGLFDPGTVITLRYLLSSRWNFEAEQATEFSRASFNYRLER